MRIIPLLAVASLLCSGCGAPVRGPVDTLELTGGIRSATINKDGKGSFYSSHTGGEGFAITPEAFRRLEARLAKYRDQAKPKNKLDLNADFCPPPLPHVTDNGMIVVRWIGAGADDILVIDSGCDRERHAARNRDLLAIIDTLPVPKEIPPPMG